MYSCNIHPRSLLGVKHEKPELKAVDASSAELLCIAFHLSTQSTVVQQALDFRTTEINGT